MARVLPATGADGNDCSSARKHAALTRQTATAPWPMHRRSFLASLAAIPCCTAAPPADDFIFLDNGTLKLGIKKSSGAGIAWLSRSGGENLLDHYDHGRLVQQSYYGREDGTRWADKPWRWNPVQGGDYKGHASEVLALTSDKTTLHARIRPRHWADGQLLADCEMEQHVRLEGALAIVKFRFRYTGTETHPARHQEVPAVFLHPSLSTLVHYDGDQPWTGAPLQRSQPGWPNESRKIPEGWAAYVNDKGTGAGVYAPIAKELTCYRFGAKPAAPSACSYFAPLVTFAITPGLDFTYEAALTTGTPDEMRAAFSTLRGKLVAKVPGGT